MIYLGGKYRIAKHLLQAMQPYLERHEYSIWEPFCGGLNFSRLLVGCTGVLSDKHPALIACYQAYRDGWEPPTRVTREMYEAAKRLPDSDPLKAFVGFGCSFGGKYFGGYVKDVHTALVTFRDGRSPQWVTGRKSKAAAESLRPLRSHLSELAIERRDFLSCRAKPTRLLIYCDPPYEGVTGYGRDTFDHRLFWRQCQKWARYTTVLVSEYACPVPAELLWEMVRNRNMTRTASEDMEAPVERLFRVLPPYRYRIRRELETQARLA